MLTVLLNQSAQAEALNVLRSNGTFSVVVRLALVVLISIVISHAHAEPV